MTQISHNTEEEKMLREMAWEKKREKQEDTERAGAVLGRLLWEVIIVSVLWGIMDEWSWWTYPLVIAGGIGMIYMGTIFRSMLIIGLSILWGLGGAALLMWAFTGFNDALASMWIVLDSSTYIIEAIVIFLISIYIHRRGFKSMEFASQE